MLSLPTKKIIGVYRVTNRVNGKSYIGKSINIYARWRNHLLGCKKPREKDLAFHRALIKYGEDNFDWQIILQLGEQNDYLLCVMERFFIAEFSTLTSNGNGYNETPGGEGHPGKRSPEYCRKLKERCAKREKIPVSKETREKMSKAHKGKKKNFDPKKMSLASKNRWIDINIRGQMITTRKVNVLKKREWGIRVGTSDFDGFHENYFTSVKEAAKYYGVSPDGFIRILNNQIKTPSQVGRFFSNVQIDKVPFEKVLLHRPDLQ